MFGFLKRKAIPINLAELNTEQIKKILKENSPEEAGRIVRRAAAEGSSDSAVFLSHMFLRLIGLDGTTAQSTKVRSDFVFYTALAARRGDIGSQFNMAKHYLSLVNVSGGEMDAEEYEDLCRAESWLKKAAAGGLIEAKQTLVRMGEIFTWAHSVFEPAEWEKIGSILETRLEDLINRYGLESVVTAAAREVVERISNKDVAYEFMLQELDGASQGNEYAQIYARSSGIPSGEYEGALNKSVPEVDGPDGPQQFLLKLALMLSADRELMAKFRCDVGAVVQKHFKLGFHSPNYDAFGAIFE